MLYGVGKNLRQTIAFFARFVVGRVSEEALFLAPTLMRTLAISIHAMALRIWDLWDLQGARGCNLVDWAERKALHLFEQREANNTPDSWTCQHATSAMSVQLDFILRLLSLKKLIC